MPALSGGRLGPYEILGPLGTGGMGEVYKAHDPRLDRIVALKVLPVAVAGDPVRLQRFEHESRVLSSLNHPHIVTVHELGRDESTTYMAMEFVEGRTLHSLLLSGPLPLKKLAEVATQMAVGLAAAHRAGIVHRDVKPSNVMVSKDGFVKILDFGLAKTALAIGQDDSTASAGLEAGGLVGTVEYMSPEQARGQSLDARSDQFSLGTVLYQMATGVRPFHRRSAADTISAILNYEPPSLATVRAEIPAPLRWVVARCLAKDPEDRFGCTHDVASVLAGIRDLIDTTPRKPPALAARWVWLAATAALVAVGALLWKSPPWQSVPPPATVRFSVAAPRQGTFDFDSKFPAPPAISPDGRHLVFGSRDAEGRNFLWVRSLDGLDSRVLPGTDGASYPFWSPDSRFVAFFADGKIKKTEMTGGAVQTLGEARDGRGGSWSSSGVILFCPDNESPLYRIPASGGPATEATRLDQPPPFSHRWPHFLPDGEHFLYALTSPGPPYPSELYVGSLGSGPPKKLLTGASNAAYVAPGYVLFAREDTLMAQRFDLGTLEAVGEAVPVVDGVHSHPQRRNSSFAVSALALAYQPEAVGARSRLAWLDHAGAQLAGAGAPGDYGGVRLSPDGQRFAVEVRDRRRRTTDIWVLDVAHGVPVRVTSGAHIDDCPVWSHDGGSIFFTSNRTGRWDLYRRSVTAAAEDVVWQSDADKTPTDVSADGRFLLYNQGGPQTKNRWDLWYLSEQKASPFLETAFSERDGRLSPDGRWIAYASDESGVSEVYVSTFPRLGSKRRISVSGGTQPVWDRAGRKLFYVAADNRLMSVAMRFEGGVQAALPTVLFDSRIAPSASDIPLYDVSADGRFLLSLPSVDNQSQVLNIVVNWVTALRP